MTPRFFVSAALVLAVSFAASNSAEAQLGKLGGAIKKKAAEKAAEAAAGKDKAAPVDSAKAGATPAKGTATANAPAAAKAVAAPPLVIDADVLTRFAKSLDLEVSRRATFINRSACAKKVEGSQEAMDLMMWMSAEANKIDKSAQADEKKVEEVNKLIAVTEQKKTDLEVKKCGPVVEEMYIPQHEKIAAEAGAFEHSQYARLKERVLPYCAARAKGSDTPTNAKLVYTPEEMTAMQPRCTALLATLKKLG